MVRSRSVKTIFCGGNRISVGAQTFDADLLRFLGRVHSADETRQALSSIREAGFDNFSLDLIHGIPGQTVDGVSQDLSRALECEPPHLSAYNLTIEEGTPFHARYRQGLLKPLDEEVETEMADRIQRTLAQAGLERYEVSNYARPRFNGVSGRDPRTLSPKSRTGSHRACWQRTANGCALRHEASCWPTSSSFNSCEH